MSGPEWTPEHPAAPVEGRPLSGNPSAAGPTPPPSSPTIGGQPFPTGRARPADPDQVERDDAAAEANRHDDEEAATTSRRKIAALLGSIRALVVGLWNRRRRADRPAVDYDQSADPAPPPAEPTDPLADAAGEPHRAPRWSPAAWTWETRVGVAAVLSFLVLVGVLVVQKGWIGGRRSSRVIAAINNPAQATQSPKAAGSGTPKHPADPAPPTTSPPPPGEAGLGGEAANTPVAPPNGTIVAQNDAPPVPGTLPPPTLGAAGAGAVSSLTSPTDGDPTSPPVLPGKTADVPPLPADSPGGGLPAMPGSVATTEETTAKPPGGEAAPSVDPASRPEPAAQPTTDATVTTTAPAATSTPAPPDRSPAASVQPPVVAVAPVEPSHVKTLEPVPVATEGPAPSRGPDWVVIPSGGKRPGIGAGSPLAAASGGDDPASNDAPARSRIAEGPALRDEPTSAAGQGRTALHTVQADENYWTISKQFYGSGRYYKALHKANAGQVPDNIKELYIGTVLRVPPPEALDRTLIEPPVLGAAIDGPAVSRTSSTTRSAGTSSDSGTASDDDSAMPAPRSARPGLRRARTTEPVEAPRRPTYTVKANDTLRSIARDTLGDNHRAGEIYNLNRDLLDDARSIPAPGTTLTLPTDAVIGRRMP